MMHVRNSKGPLEHVRCSQSLWSSRVPLPNHATTAGASVTHLIVTLVLVINAHQRQHAAELRCAESAQHSMPYTQHPHARTQLYTSNTRFTKTWMSPTRLDAARVVDINLLENVLEALGNALLPRKVRHGSCTATNTPRLGGAHPLQQHNYQCETQQRLTSDSGKLSPRPAQHVSIA